LALPSLTNLHLQSGEISITSSSLPALQALEVQSSGSTHLAHTDMPALTTLQVEGSTNATSLGVADAALPALRSLTVRKCSVGLERASLPALHSLELRRVHSVTAPASALPAMRTVLLDSGATKYPSQLSSRPPTCLPGWRACTASRS
jgi:hypothetical protein